MYAHILKYLRISKYSLPIKIYAHILKYLRIYKIYAPHPKCSRLIIYDSNKAAVEIFPPYKRCMRPEIGAQTLTIWARQNLQLLTPSQSGWRALVQVMLSLLHAVLKWDVLPGRPAYMGGGSAILYRLLYRHDLPKYSRPVQMFAAANIFTFFLGKIKNLTRLISVLSLQFKLVHDHKSCPDSAVTLLSP